MNEQPLYRWLDQQGEAFGAPGLEPHWTSSVKDAIGTAYAASSRVWFTCSHGILNEVYHPTIDHAQVRDMEFLITDGETFAHEEKRDLITSFEYIHPEALGVRYVNRDPEGRYALTKEMMAVPFILGGEGCKEASQAQVQGPAGGRKNLEDLNPWTGCEKRVQSHFGQIASPKADSGQLR